MANGNGISKYIKNPAIFIEILIMIVIVVGAFTTVKIQAENTQSELTEFKIEFRDKYKSQTEIELNLKTLMAHFDIEYQELD